MSEARSVASVLVRVSPNGEDWDKLAEECRNLLKNVASSVFLHGAATNGTPPQFLAKLGLDPQIIAEYSTNLVEDSMVARRRYQKVIGEHTRVQTYDMLGENTEGYARVLRLFSDLSREPEVTWQYCLQLIGTYSLEPFKVLALWVSTLLDIPEYFDPFVQWVKNSMWFRHPDWPVLFDMVRQWPPLSELIAKLVVQGAVEYPQAYASIDPKRQGLELHEAKFNAEKTQSSSNALAMAMPLVDDDEDENGEAEIESPGRLEAMEVDEEDDTKEHMQTYFLALGALLCELSVSPNPQIETEILALIVQYPLAFGSSDFFTSGLSKYVAAKLPELGLEGVKPMLMPHAIEEPAWSALCEEADLDFFRKYLLPSVDLHSDTQPFLWKLDATERYALYADLHTRVAESNPLVKERFSESEKHTKSLLKRLTKQDSESHILPQLFVAFARCPWPSLNVLVNQVENYNIGQLVAKSSTLKIPPLAMDMLPLILMQQFTAEGRTTKQDDGLFDQKWFRLLAQFAGDIAVTYNKFDFVSLIKLVLQQIAENDFSEIVVIDQLLRRLSGIPPQQNLSITQLVALSTAEPVSSVVSANLSEQHNPQRHRLVSELTKANLLTDVFLALAYAHKNTSGKDAKVVASRLDQITGILLTYTQLLEEPLDASLLEQAGVHPEFAKAATRHKSGPYEFWNLQLYDIVFDLELYNQFTEICDAKAVERASLSHRLRVKSVRQQIENCPKPSTHELVSRLVLSPADALYTSRFVQCAMPESIKSLLTREVVLAILRAGTPLEAESFACFVTDILEFCVKQEDTDMALLREVHDALHGAILEAAYPEAAYTPLSNTFTFIQRSLLVFPMFEDHGNSLTGRIKLLTTKMQGDLETAVKSLSPQLTKRATFWQSREASLNSEFVQQITQNNERLVVRLISSVKLSTEAPIETPEPEDRPARNSRRADTRKRPRGKKSRR